MDSSKVCKPKPRFKELIISSISDLLKEEEEEPICANPRHRNPRGSRTFPISKLPRKKKNASAITANESVRSS